MPWRDGGSPVVIEVSAAGVVDGTTVVIGPPGEARSSGSRSGKAWSASQPRPSSTRSTVARAPATGCRHPLDRPHAEQRRDHAR